MIVCLSNAKYNGCLREFAKQHTNTHTDTHVCVCVLNLETAIVLFRYAQSQGSLGYKLTP